MGRIPEETLQTVRDRVDLVVLVGRHVALKKAGRSFKGLCPVHHEKTPSFTVSAVRGTYHCVGCGEGGNAFAFLMRLENLTFPEAVRSLAAQHGITIPETGRGEEPGLVERVLEANAVAQRLYTRALLGDGPEGGHAQAALAASIFHFREISVGDLKRRLAELGVPVRLPRSPAATRLAPLTPGGGVR